MTRVRKINVSQVEGNNANNTDSYEIRPFGEIGIYENTDNNSIKTELLMFDGNRNNLRSKVLSKGTFYGGDADSGDGAGLDTIKLIPDAQLHRAGGDYDNDQYLIIDPTGPDHIHIRAGGPIDSSTANLILGGEKNNVIVSDNSGEVSITAEAVLGSKTWTFDQEGNLTLPVAGDILDSNGDSVLGGSSGDQNVWVQTFESETGSAEDAVVVVASVEYDVNGNIIALFNHNDFLGGTSYYSVGKFTSAGVKIWTARFVDGFNTDGWGLAVNGGDGDQIYVGGSTQSDIPESYSSCTLTRINADDGTVAWSKKYDFGIATRSTVVDVAADGMPVMVGYAGNGDDNYVMTTKVNDETGNVIWSRKLDGQNGEEAYGMAVGAEGEIVVVGWMEQLGLGSTNAASELAATPTSNSNWTLPGTVNVGGLIIDFVFNAGVATLTVREDAVGNRTIGDQITTILGSTIGGADGVDDMIVTVASVDTAVGTMDDRMLVVRYLANGTIDWQKAIEFDQGYDCRGADADIDSDGNIYVTGEYDRDINGGTASALSIVKFDVAGAKQWSRRVEGGCETFGSSIVVGPDNKLYLSGMTLTEQSGKYIWVVAKYGFDGTVEWQRLIENTSSWSFAGGNFFSQGGGSNLAVKQDYVVLGGGFGNLADDEVPVATMLQISSAGDLFAVGNWDFKAASFSGTINNTASDINMYPGGKTDSDNAGAIDADLVTLTTEVADFLIGTLQRVGATADDRLVNGTNELVLETNGTLTLPQGGTITEGYVTSNPTIQLKPANPDVASQKLVIKGGSTYNVTDNGITLSYSQNIAMVNDVLYFYVDSNTYADQTLYWWIYPTEAGIGDSNSGTVVLTSGSGSFSIEIDSDDYEFTVRVSPEAGNYDPASLGVESYLINSDAPTYPSEYHLHLTTGDLTETCIFLGTDDHNVRTTTDGKVQITTGGQFNICTIQTAGSGYTSGTTIPAQTTGGTGTGMTVNFGYGIDGQLVNVSVANPGEGYTNGDVITVGGGTGTFVLTRYNDFANQGNSNSLQSAWDFSADGTLTLPGYYNSRITEDAPGVVVYSDNGFALVAGASTPVASYAVEFTGFVDNGAGLSGATLHVTAMIAGTITDGMTIYGNGLPGGGQTLAFGGVSGTLGTGGVGNYNLTGADLLITSQSFNNNVAAPVGPKTWMFDDEGDLTLPGNLQSSAEFSITVPGSIPSGIANISNPDGGWGGHSNPLSTTGGTGTGLTVNASSSQENGYIDVVTIANPGSGYTDGDTITITSGGASATFTVSVVSPSWLFDNAGDITLPDDGDIINGDSESFLKDIPQNYPTGYTEYPYILQASDRGRHILIDGSDYTAIWVPTDATSPMPIGSTIVIVAKPGPGPYTVWIGAEDSYGAMTIYGAGVGTNTDYQLDPSAGGAMATLIKIGANEWMLSGTGLSQAEGI